VNVRSYTPKDRRIDTALIVGGLIVGGLAIYYTRRDKEEQQAARFLDVWELMEPDALMIANRERLVYPYEIQRLAPRVPIVDNMVRWLGEDAAGTLNDREDLALAACMRPTYAELLLFTQRFVQAYALSPGAYMLTFMDPDNDASVLAAIVRHVDNLRARNAQTHP